MALVFCQTLSDQATLPKKQSLQAAGFDLASPTNVVVEPGEWKPIPLDIALAIPPGYCAKIASRSGLAFQKKITVFEGTIDSDYRGNLTVLFQNHGNEAFQISRGDRIAQLVVHRICDAEEMIEVSKLSPTKRGSAGFGSTSI